MGHSHNLKLPFYKRFFLAMLSLLILISITSQPRFMAEGRAFVVKHIAFSQGEIENEEIGSRPPRCERRCSSCSHCEAVQVPVNPQEKSAGKDSLSHSSAVTHGRRDDNSNYKPLSWKCKCGTFLFNP